MLVNVHRISLTHALALSDSQMFDARRSPYEHEYVLGGIRTPMINLSKRL